MADNTDAPKPLAPEQAAQLTDFARACKAAARAVTLYPMGHPAITATLGRIVHVTSPTSLRAPLKVTVLPAALLLDGRAPARADQAIGELAVLLHDHLVGELIVHPAATPKRGAISCCSSAARRLGPLRRRHRAAVDDDGRPPRGAEEIDYADVLRERSDGGSPCGNGDLELPARAIVLLRRGGAEDSARLVGDAGSSASSWPRSDARERADPACRRKPPRSCACCAASSRSCQERDRIAGPGAAQHGVRGRPPVADLMMGLLSHGSGSEGDADDEDTPRLVSAVVSRMSEARSRGSSRAT